MKKNKGQKGKEKNSVKNRIKSGIQKIIKPELSKEDLESIRKKTESHNAIKNAIEAEEKRKEELISAMNKLQDREKQKNEVQKDNDNNQKHEDTAQVKRIEFKKTLEYKPITITKEEQQRRDEKWLEAVNRRKNGQSQVEVGKEKLQKAISALERKDSER